ncbi:MAG: diacylglycerol/polyprenol kinase family protein [Promethearchaeota archaeon]
MTLFDDLILVLLTYMYIVLVIIIPVQLKKRNKISKFTARKTVHLLAGLSVLVTPFFTYPAFAIVIAGSLTVLVFFSSKESKVKKLKELYDSIGEEAEEQLKRKFLQGPFNYCLSITILITVFVIFAPNQLYFPMAGVLIMIVADTMASIVGKRYGKISLKLPWTGRRTVIGSLTMFSFSFLLSLGSFWYFGLFNPLTQIPLTWDIIILYAFITGLLATIIEILSPSTWDDLTVPICSTIIIYLLTFVYL